MARKLGELPHQWAHQTRQSGRSGNVSFDGDTFYSYSTAIGRFVRQKDGRKAVFVSSNRYSNTTACHIGAVEAAVSHMPQFVTDYVADAPGKIHIAEFRSRIDTAMRYLGATNKQGLPRRLAELQKVVTDANAFCEAFGFKTRFSLPDNVDEIIAEARTQEAKDAKRKAVAEAKAMVAARVKLAEWLGVDVKDVSIADVKFSDHMRLMPSKKVEVYDDASSEWVFQDTGVYVETTKHATVSVKDVKKVAKLVLRHVKSGESWKANGEQIRVGNYSLNAITSDGTLIVGCHKFARSEIERFAKVLGV